MPVHKVGYRKWDGQKTPQWNRWWIITESGFKTAFKSAWVRRILLVCWLPVLYWGIGLFVIEQGLERNAFATAKANSDTSVMGEAAAAEINRQIAREFRDEMDMLPEIDALTRAIESRDKLEIRHTIWSWLLMTFFRYPQGMAMLFLLGFVTPSLISQDVRSRAFLLYFSRPIGRFEYLLGKILIPIVFLFLITTLPAICLFIFGVTLSPDLSVLQSTWDIPFRIAAASMVVIIPSCSIALMLSSITQESRFATFAWFTIWALGFAAWFAVLVTQAINLRSEPFESDVLNDPVVTDWSRASLYHNFTYVQSWIFGFQPLEEIWPSICVLISITLFSLAVLYRGISAPMNV